MSSPGSVTQFIDQLKAGDREAARQLWEHYFQQLVALARRKLPSNRRRVADEEDVALSALDSMCRGASEGRFPDLYDRHGLWPLLVTITVRKAGKLVQRERRQKRGGDRVRGDSALMKGKAEGTPWEQLFGREPSPALAAQVAEECNRLMEQLPTEELRSVARWKMEGWTNAEIAKELGCVEGTVERKLRVIRSVWGKEYAP